MLRQYRSTHRNLFAIGIFLQSIWRLELETRFPMKNAIENLFAIESSSSIGNIPGRILELKKDLNYFWHTGICDWIVGERLGRGYRGS